MTQTTDAALVERLRDEARHLQKAAWGKSDGRQDCSISSMLADEAADTIEAQARRIEALEGALRPFAKAGTLAGERDPRWDFYVYRPGAGDEYAIMGDHLRDATAALEPTP
jgi:hypothetical protein